MSTDPEPSSDALTEHREQVENPLYQLFMRYGRGNRRWFVVGVVTSTLARFLSLLPPVLLGAAIDSVFGGDQALSIPYLPQSYVPASEMGQFWFAVSLMAVAMVGSAFLNFARQSSLNLFSHRVKHEVRTATYQQMQRLDMGFFNEMQTGELMSILSNDTNRLEQFLDNMMGNAIQLGVLMLGTAAVCWPSTGNSRW
jgi:ATP-binding cassette subfamily B protein